ncbi:MAG: tetratricopeptide repeat protein [Leptolyngbyaceae cyanobacterium SM1_4_3]|nr:tetratricopeptide repeat protein [Leptolyngbyaceae cyanobacterium SM1_4_3]
MSHLQKLLTSFCIVAILILSLELPTAWAEPVEQLVSPSQAVFQTGIAAFHNENYQRATEAFTQVIQQQPDFAPAYSNRCLTHLVLNQYQQAIADCTQGLQLDPTHAEFYLNRGLAYDRLGEYQNAVADYNQLLQLQPHDYRAYYNRGLAQVALGEKIAALADYNQSLQYTPSSSTLQRADILNDRGVVYLQLQEPQHAIADFTQAISLNANDAKAYFNRACACHHEGDFFGSTA